MPAGSRVSFATKNRQSKKSVSLSPDFKEFYLQAYEEAGIQVQNVSKLAVSQTTTTSAEVTLNALNASESEGDVESLEFGNGEQVR